MSALRYIGRKRHDVPEDKLFVSDLHYISDGGVVLYRKPSDYYNYGSIPSGDDYFRLRVPDTDCPPLPMPPPEEPLDDGRVDIVEPNRWVRKITSTSNGWTFNPESWSDEGTLGSPYYHRYHYVQTSYACYSSGSLGPGDGKSIVAYFSTTYRGRDPIPFVEANYRLSLCIVDICYLTFNYVGIGVASLYYPYEGTFRTSSFAMAYSLGGDIWSFTGLNQLPVGTRPEHSGEFYLALVFPVGVTSGYIGQIFLKHPGGYYYKAGEMRLPGPNVGGPVEVGRLAPPIRLPDPAEHSLPVKLPGYYTCRAIRTQYPPGVSTRATLITKVHDLGQPRAIAPTTFPDNVPLIWRASNTPFEPGDATPSWTSPTGEYRYWQFQIPNFSDHDKLVERIELNIASPGDGDPGDEDPGDRDPGDRDPGDGDPGDGDPGDRDPGDGDPGDGGRVPSEETTPLPRNVGLYYTIGDLSASYYGSTIRLPASLLMALNINNDWRAYSTVDLGSSALVDEESRPRLYDEYIGYLQSGRHGRSVEIPYPVDSVGGLRGALMMKLSAALLFAGREILSNINKPDIEAQLAAYIKDYLGTIEWVSSSTVSVTVSSGHIHIDCLVSIHDQVERISLSITGG